MNDVAPPSAYGALIEPATLKIQRRLPGRIERVWAYLTESDLRKQWLASGQMEMKVGATVELTWRNDQLTDPPGQRPAGFGAEHSMQSTITELDPPRRLAFTFGAAGHVTFELEPKGDATLLTVTHRRLPDERAMKLKVSAGWHAHLDVLAARIAGTAPAPFWDHWSRLQQDYDKALPA
jgi:uncharacterized protein YndB with AHSA1/START domain